MEPFISNNFSFENFLNVRLSLRVRENVHTRLSFCKYYDKNNLLANVQALSCYMAVYKNSLRIFELPYSPVLCCCPFHEYTLVVREVSFVNGFPRHPVVFVIYLFLPVSQIIKTL